MTIVCYYYIIRAEWSEKHAKSISEFSDSSHYYSIAIIFVL